MSDKSAECRVSRRKFLSLSSAAAATLGIAPLAGNASDSFAEANTSSDDYYAKLGVEKIINAAGTYTYLTAACMPPAGAASRGAGGAASCPVERAATRCRRISWRKSYAARPLSSLQEHRPR